MKEGGAALPFMARASCGWNIVIALMYPLLLWAFFVARTSDDKSAMLDFWYRAGLMDRASNVIMAIVVPGIPFEIF